jgi:glycosyltransferase involved in cell wall biosynthesis
MRIAMIGSRGIPARSGGIERVVEELTRELSLRGHEVLVYGRRHYVGSNGRPGPGRVILTPGLGGKHLDAITHTATASLDVLRRKVDVVHVHAVGPALMSWLPALAHLPVVLTVHAPDWRRDKWSLPAKAILRGGLACGMRVAKAVTAVSKDLVGELTSMYNRRVEYVPNAVRPVELRGPKIIERWRLRREQYGLYVGRIVPEKRLDLLMEAWRMADVSLPLVVVGDYAESGYGRLCRARAGDNVLFVGPQHEDALAELYSNAAVFVQPSALEGMSLVLLEAAAYGRCILAAEIPANTGAMADSILYFDKDDPDDLAGMIRRCVTDPQARASCGSTASAFVRKTYSWNAVAGRFERVYTEAAS